MSGKVLKDELIRLRNRRLPTILEKDSRKGNKNKPKKSMKELLVEAKKEKRDKIFLPGVKKVVKTKKTIRKMKGNFIRDNKAPAGLIANRALVGILKYISRIFR